MPKRVLVITVGVCIVLICSTLMYSLLHNSAKNKEEIALKQRKTYFLQHDYATNYQQQEFMMLGGVLTREAEACNRMHLSKAEKSKRLHAVDKACLEEMRRVQSSGFRSAFRPPPTD